jgi:VanZ family protein
MKFRYWFVAYFFCVVYASFYPFVGWKDPSLLMPGLLDLFASGLPRYWTGFDVIANVLAYVPLGLMLSWGLQIRYAAWISGLAAALGLSVVSIQIEWVQVLLPGRVPSLLDWILNSLGATTGALLAGLAEREKVEDWIAGHFRFLFDRESPSQAARFWLLGLLVLWLVAQLAPQAIAFAVGDVLGENRIVETTLGQAYGPLLEAGATALSVLVIGLMLQPLLGSMASPLALTIALFAFATLAKAAVAAWLLGPSAAFGWFSAAAQGGLLVGLSALSVVSMATRYASPRRLWLILFCLVGLVLLFNLAPESDYHRTLMLAWGPKPLRAIEGLLNWIGILWPALVLLYCVRQLYNKRSPRH